MSTLSHLADTVERNLQDARVYSESGRSYPVERVLETMREMCQLIRPKSGGITTSSDIESEPCRFCGAPSERKLLEAIPFEDHDEEREPEHSFLCGLHYRALFQNEKSLPKSASVLFAVARRLGVKTLDDILPRLDRLLGVEVATETVVDEESGEVRVSQ